MKSETSDRHDPKEDVDEVELQKKIRTFKRLTKFQTCTAIEICIFKVQKNLAISVYLFIKLVMISYTVRA